MAMALKGEPWYELYANLRQYLKANSDGLCLSQSISFLNANLDITVDELPLIYAFMWRIKSKNSVFYHMEDRFDMIAPNDLIAFILFTEVLIVKKGKADISKIRYIALFTTFQYLLGQKIAGEIKVNECDIRNIKLFDFDSYDVIYTRLKGVKLPD